MTQQTLYDQFETSEKAEVEDGIMIQIPGSNAKFWCKRAGGANVNFTKFVEKQSRKSRVGGRDFLTSEAGEQMLREGLARHVIFKWENVTDRKGKSRGEYAPEKAIELMTDLPDLIMIIYNQASNPEFFLAADETMEDEAKN